MADVASFREGDPKSNESWHPSHKRVVRRGENWAASFMAGFAAGVWRIRQIRGRIRKSVVENWFQL